MAHDIFISYSNKDKPIADAICVNLEGAGVRCWIAPRDIAPGEDWPTSITRAISQSRVMVLVFSAHSNSSEDVSRELFLAANSKLVIIPFKIENIEPEPGKQYYLARTHWLDAINPPTQEQIHALIDCVKTLIPGRDPAANITPPGVLLHFDQPIPGNESAQPPVPGPIPKRRPAWRRFLWIRAMSLLLLGLTGVVILTFVTHTLPVPMLAWATATSTATKTITISPTPAASMTPTPDLFAGYVASIAKIYQGPGIYYPLNEEMYITGNVTILGQIFDCSWLKVTSPSGNSGWLSADSLTSSPECSEIPAIAATKSGCPLTSTIIISNLAQAGNIQLRLYLHGPEFFTFMIQSNNSTVYVCPGTYTYTFDGCWTLYDGTVSSGNTLNFQCK